jgi:hypothetical protein
MFTFRCTQKLIKRLSLPVISNPPNPTTQLGDWYGNVLLIRHKQLMMFVSDRSLLPVIMPIRERQNLLINFQKRLSTLLIQLGIEEQLVSDELDQMDEFVIAPTTSKSVLGSMNDFILTTKTYFQMYDNIRLLDIELLLAETPIGPMDYRSPNQVAPELLALGSGR